MFTIERRIGRLAEIRIEHELRIDEMSLYRARFASALQSVAGKMVFVSDVRTVESVTHEVEEQGTQLMRVAGQRIERAGMLVGKKGTFGVQLLRASLNSNSRIRLVSDDAAEVQRWLGEVLGPSERARLHEFLCERPQI